MSNISSFAVAETKEAILRRATKTPLFAVVPEHAIKMFDRIIEQTETEALSKHPKDKWARIQFWKDKIMSRVLPRLRGVVAGYYHEYVAALKRNDTPEVELDDSYGFSSRPYNEYAEAIAQRDAYLACTASLR